MTALNQPTRRPSRTKQAACCLPRLEFEKIFKDRPEKDEKEKEPENWLGSGPNQGQRLRKYKTIMLNYAYDNNDKTD